MGKVLEDTYDGNGYAAKQYTQDQYGHNVLYAQGNQQEEKQNSTRAYPCRPNNPQGSKVMVPVGQDNNCPHDQQGNPQACA